jgi:hypothetical protein
MLDGGGGGGYGGTSWAGMSVTDMWLAIGNQETSKHWQLLTGWRKSYELTQQHMAAVKRYRENLAAAWPPEKSPAAAAYVAQLDTLLANLQQTYDAAVANYTAFSGATLALSSARRDLEKVFTEYVANEGKLAGFEKERANRPVAAGKSALPPLKSPVAEGRQAELEGQARSIMYGLSSEIIQARTQVVKPNKFVPSSHITGGESEREGTGYSAPAIPTVVPFDPGSQSSPATRPNSDLGSYSSSQSTPSSPNTPRQPGLVLGGANSPATPPPSPNVSPPNVTAGGPTSPNGPLAPSTTPFSPTPQSRQSTTSRSLPPVIGQPVAGTGPSQRALPPGGIIGATPTSGLGQPTAGTRAPTTVNPVGGVLGQNAQPTGRASGARPALTQSQPLSVAGQRNSNDHADPERNTRWDPNNPWQTATGVDPVVSPPPVQRVDPGPAIGLT